MIAMVTEMLQATSLRTKMETSEERRFVEFVAVISVGVLLTVLALTMNAVRTGDGAYYYAMLDALAYDGSPAITERTAALVRNQLGLEVLTGLSQSSQGGKVYAWHFFAYPLLCVPAYKLLMALNFDGLKAFQMTNAIIIFFALLYVLCFSNLGRKARWVIAAGFLFSTGCIYFQWTHPEVYTAASVLIASVSLIERRYVLAVLASAIGSFQNPSVALLIPVIFAAQTFEICAPRGCTGVDRALLRCLLKLSLASSLILVPYIWNYRAFGVFNPIAESGYIDYININLNRFLSFVFDINQGLAVGLPILVWAVPVVIILRLCQRFFNGNRIFGREDILLLGFLLMMLPTLAQTNWNSGSSVFLRYASWSGMVLVVWVASLLNRLDVFWFVIAAIPAVTLQIGMILYFGGVSFLHHPSYVSFAPWVDAVWRMNPHIYNPDPEIFFERLVGQERAIATPAIFKNEDGVLLRVLTRESNIKSAGAEVCGSGIELIPIDYRKSSQLRLTESNNGFHYISGRFVCDKKIRIPAIISVSSEGAHLPDLLRGWSLVEKWGVWTNGPYASLRLKIEPISKKRLDILFVGDAFVTEMHPRQEFEVIFKKRLVAKWVSEYPNKKIEETLSVNSDDFEGFDDALIEFRIPNAISPKKLGISEDSRALGFGLKEVRLSYSADN